MPAHSILPHHASDAPGPVARSTRLPARVTHAGPVPDRSRYTWALPALLAFALGLYTVFLAHENGFSELGGWLLGLAAAAISFAVGHVLVRERNAMNTELRAIGFGVLAGGSIGFLHVLSGGSVLRSSGIGLFCGMAVAVAAYYIFYWHEH